MGREGRRDKVWDDGKEVSKTSDGSVLSVLGDMRFPNDHTYDMTQTTSLFDSQL